jgi:hypothetical protein
MVPECIKKRVEPLDPVFPTVVAIVMLCRFFSQIREHHGSASLIDYPREAPGIPFIDQADEKP